MKSLRSTERREPVASALATRLQLHRNVLLLEAGTVAFGGPVDLAVLRIAADLALDELIQAPCPCAEDVQLKLRYVLDGDHAARIQVDLLGAEGSSERLVRFLRSLVLPAAPRGRRPRTTARPQPLRVVTATSAATCSKGST